jgi:hypothetical protein
MGSGSSLGEPDVSLHDDPGCAREPHTPPGFVLEWACRDLSDRGRQLFTLDHHHQTWRWVDRYFFYRDVFTDTIFGQQFRWSQVFQIEDPGEEVPVCMQGADSRGQSSLGPAW